MHDVPGAQLSIEPGSPQSEFSDAQVDAFFASLFDDSFPELNDQTERRHLVGVASRLSNTQTLAISDAKPPADLQSRVLYAIRNEASASAALRAPAPKASTTVATTANPSIAATTPQQPSSHPTPPRNLFKRFRVRILVVLVALVAAITALFSSFGSSPVIAATAILAPNPGSPTPTASGTADFLSAKKGGAVNKVEMTVTGLTPNSADDEYQCWLVGKGDSPASPHRILVGTFSTDDGSVKFDWKTTGYSPDFAQLDISLEKKDGNAAYGGVTVLSTIQYSGKRTG